MDPRKVMLLRFKMVSSPLLLVLPVENLLRRVMMMLLWPNRYEMRYICGVHDEWRYILVLPVVCRADLVWHGWAFEHLAESIYVTTHDATGLSSLLLLLPVITYTYRKT